MHDSLNDLFRQARAAGRKMAAELARPNGANSPLVVAMYSAHAAEYQRVLAMFGTEVAGQVDFEFFNTAGGSDMTYLMRADGTA